MRKLMFAFVLLVMLIPLAAAQPPFKDKTPPGQSRSTSDTSSDTTETEVVYVNQTAPAQDEGINWEMIGVIVVIIGGIVGWIISRMVRSKTAKYMSEIDKAYKSNKANPKKCEAELEKIRMKIDDDFKKGKLNDQALSILEKRLDKYTSDIRRNIIDKRFDLPKGLTQSINKMLADGVITKDEYSHFVDIMKKADVSSKDKEELKKLMKRWRTGKE